MSMPSSGVRHQYYTAIHNNSGQTVVPRALTDSTCSMLALSVRLGRLPSCVRCLPYWASRSGARRLDDQRAARQRRSGPYLAGICPFNTCHSMLLLAVLWCRDASSASSVSSTATGRPWWSATWFRSVLLNIDLSILQI